MPASSRATMIDNFIQELHQPFENVFPLTSERADYIADKYFGAVKAISDPAAQPILALMKESIATNTDHDRIREWKRCCYGVADYLLRPRDLDGSDRVVAAGVVVRLSGYVHHRIPFFLAFRPTAIKVADAIWGSGVLQYEKTGGAITIDEGCLTPDGFINLWDFAKGSPEEVLRSEDETRALASRILNFLCQNNYARVRITSDAYEHIKERFEEDEHILYRWSIGDKNVDLICQNIEIPASHVLAFLRSGGFDSNRTYKPGRDTRYRWFRDRWKKVQ
jgi:hypothetical protein